MRLHSQSSLRKFYKNDLWLKKRTTPVPNHLRSIVYEDTLLLPDAHPRKPFCLNLLGHLFMAQHMETNDETDLDRAISAHDDTVRLTPGGSPDLPARLIALGDALVVRYNLIHNEGDLDRSVAAHRDAVRLGHADKPDRLGILGILLLRRFDRSSSLADIDQSIRFMENAVRLTPYGRSDKPLRLNILGISLLRRFECLGILADIDQSIQVIGQAVRLTPDGHISKPSLLNNLGTSLFSRFKRLGDLSDLDQSIHVKEQVIRLTPDGNAAKPGRLTNLGCSLLARFARLGDMADIDQSTQAMEKAIQLTPEGHAGKPGLLIHLGNWFLGRFVHLGNRADLGSATIYFSRAADSSIGSPSHRFRAAQKWVRCTRMAETSSMDAFRCALNLLPRVVWLGLPMTDRQQQLVEIGDFVYDAAAAAIEEGDLHTAIEWLEQGRSVVWGKLLNLRSPIDVLRAREPALAQRLEQTSIALEQAGARGPGGYRNSPISLEEASRAHRQLASEWDELVEKARAIPGFEDFLQPKQLSHLTRAASAGPVVVINVHKSRCDALVLIADLDDVIHIPLDSFSNDQAEELQDMLDKIFADSGVRNRSSRDPVRFDFEGNNGGFEEILSELWLRVVKPVLDSLAFNISRSADKPRIWWCPTGPLAFLPLHAAGLYNTNEPGHKISDFVTSSYTPTLTALLNPSPPISLDKFEVLRIPQPSTSIQSPFPGTKQELYRIQACAGNHHIRSLRGAKATAERVVQGMKEFSWIHLPCHSTQDTANPTKSAFLFQGGQLALSEIVKTFLPQAQLSFLSVCQTGACDRRLSEEVVHLAAGMLLAGYRSVIATAWSIEDKDAPLVAEEIYSHLFENESLDSTQAAHALHHAVQRLRESPGVSFLSWVPFIHVGM